MRSRNIVCLRDLLATEFTGTWGSDPQRGRDVTTVLRATDIDSKGRISSTGGTARHVSARELSIKRLLPGDILLETSGGGPKQPVGRVALFPGDDGRHVTSNFFRTLRPNAQADSDFLMRYLLHQYEQPSIWRFQQQTTGIINLNYGDYLSQALSVPGLKEQRRIATALEVLEERMRWCERLIQKYSALRLGLITDLLTGKLAQQGQPSIELPPDWQLRRIDDVGDSIVDGPFGSNLKTEHYQLKPGIRVIRLQNIEAAGFNDSDRTFISEHHAASLHRHEVRPGDVLVASLGDDRHPCGRACEYPSHLAAGITKADCFRVRLKLEIMLPPVLVALLNSEICQGQLRGMSHGVTRDRITLSALRKVPIPVPPLNEQHKMVATLETVDHALGREQLELQKLERLRRGLADDLFTGRISVPL